MPRPGPRRPLVNVRLDPEDLERLQARADRETEGNVSELHRRIVQYGLARMPRGWRP